MYLKLQFLELLKIIFASLSILLTLVYVGYILFFIRGWKRIKVFKTDGSTLNTKVSVIVAARNEERQIERTIQAILAQDYSSSLYELIVVDDHSTDSTADIVLKYLGKGVRLIQLKEDAINSYKKKAIETAIAQAQGDLMVTTDADCVMGKNWLSSIVAYYENNTYKMISSPVAYFEERSVFEKIQALEFAYLIGMGASTIGNEKPTTCNGANLAYEKSAFYEVGGFSGIDDLASGDDELLLHKMVNQFGSQIGFLKNREAIVYTWAKSTLSEFIAQRKRWASKSIKHNNQSFKQMSILIWLFNLSIFLNIFLAIGFGFVFIQLLAFQFLTKVLIECVFLFPMMSFVKRKDLVWCLPLLSGLHVFYFVYIGISANVSSYQWKGRTVK